MIIKCGLNVVPCTTFCYSAFISYYYHYLLLKEVGSARLRGSDPREGWSEWGPKTPAPQYQPIDRRITYTYRQKANKKALALLLKPTSPTPLNAGLARSFQRDIEEGINVLGYCEVLQQGGS